MSLLVAQPVYKPFVYPWAFEAFHTQNSVLWLPEEVPLGDDVSDWNLHLTDPERNLLTQIFRFFTQADVGVNECYLTHYMQAFKPTEVRMMLSAFANMEAIHVNAYSHLLDTIGMPETEYQAFLKYREMKDKWEYMQKFNMDSPSDIAMTLAAFGAGIEGLALFASFAILLSFPRRNKMRGMGQIITWSMRDESLHCLSMIRLFHTFLQENPRVWNKSFQNKICNVISEIVRHEKSFVSLAYEMGDVDGLCSTDVHDYIDFLAVKRLTQLGVGSDIINEWLGDETPDKNPLPWLDEMMNAVEHANFFEARATEYSRAATQGTWEEAFEQKVFGHTTTTITTTITTTGD